MMAITKETFRTLIHEGQEEIRDVELYNRPFDFGHTVLSPCYPERDSRYRIYTISDSFIYPSLKYSTQHVEFLPRNSLSRGEY